MVQSSRQSSTKKSKAAANFSKKLKKVEIFGLVPNVGRGQLTDWPEDPAFMKPSAEEMDECASDRQKAAVRTFYVRFSELKKFKEENGHTNVPQKYECNEKLGSWVNKTRQTKKEVDAGEKGAFGKWTILSSVRIGKLDRVGFDWGKTKGEKVWAKRFAQLKEFRCIYKHCNVPTRHPKYKTLGRWVSTMRSEYKKFHNGEGSTQIDIWKIDLLDSIFFKWEARKSNSVELSPNEEDDSLDATDHDDLRPTRNNMDEDGTVENTWSELDSICSKSEARETQFSDLFSHEEDDRLDTTVHDDLHPVSDDTEDDAVFKFISSEVDHAETADNNMSTVPEVFGDIEYLHNMLLADPVIVGV